MDTGSLNYRWSQTLIAGLVAAGVRHAVLSPGSRSTPLTLAALRQPGLTSHMVVDERSAAFFALGIAKATRQPVIVVATSGSAPANWYPAVIEACQGGHPLLLLSADRPPELQGVGANQTIEQTSLFGKHVRACHALGTPDEHFNPAYLHRLATRVVEQAMWPLPGPVHLNLPFREPLVPAEVQPPPTFPPVRIALPHQQPDLAVLRDWLTGIAGRPGAIVCGEMPQQPEFAESLRRLAQHLACPILAEPLSNLRFGQEMGESLCVRYNSWLNDAEFVNAHTPQWVLRFGVYPVTRNLQAYVARANIQMLIEATPRWSDPGHRLTHIVRADPLAVCHALLELPFKATNEPWTQQVLQRDAEETAPAPWPATALLNELPANNSLFVGNSLLIRQLDSHSGKGNKPIRLFGNRGASGIDGNVSTALGIAVANGCVVALLGDLTTEHDLGGLALAQGLNAVIVVFNNGGGGIFDHLPQAGLPEFELGWRTPQQIDFSAAAQTFGLGYARADDGTGLIGALRQALDAGGSHLIEFRCA